MSYQFDASQFSEERLKLPTVWFNMPLFHSRGYGVDKSDPASYIQVQKPPGVFLVVLFLFPLSNHLHLTT